MRTFENSLHDIEPPDSDMVIMMRQKLNEILRLILHSYTNSNILIQGHHIRWYRAIIKPKRIFLLPVDFWQNYLPIGMRNSLFALLLRMFRSCMCLGRTILEFCGMYQCRGRAYDQAVDILEEECVDSQAADEDEEDVAALNPLEGSYDGSQSWIHGR